MKNVNINQNINSDFCTNIYDYWTFCWVYITGEVKCRFGLFFLPFNFSSRW